MRGNGVGPGGSFPQSFLCLQADIKAITVRQVNKATRRSPEATMVALGVTIRWLGWLAFIPPGREGGLWSCLFIVPFHFPAIVPPPPPPAPRLMAELGASERGRKRGPQGD